MCLILALLCSTNTPPLQYCDHKGQRGAGSIARLVEDNSDPKDGNASLRETQTSWVGVSSVGRHPREEDYATPGGPQIPQRQSTWIKREIPKLLPQLRNLRLQWLMRGPVLQKHTCTHMRTSQHRLPPKGVGRGHGLPATRPTPHPTTSGRLARCQILGRGRGHCTLPLP